MIHLTGVETFPASPGIVSAMLSDAGFLASHLPDAHAVEVAPDRAVWKVRPKVAFLSGDLETVAVVTERTPESVKYHLDTKGVGSASVVEAELKFAAGEGETTTVTWSGNVVSMSGLLKLAPKGLVQATAQKVIADCWAALKAKV